MKLPTSLFALLSHALVASASYYWDVARVGTVDSFTWTPPFPGDGSALVGYTSCESKAYFNGTQYKYIDLNEGDDRELVLMEYKDVPEAARDWIEAQMKDEALRAKRFMTILGKPGADGRAPPTRISKTCPREQDGSKCENELKNLDQYVAPVVDDKGVLAWAHTLTRPDRDVGKRDVSFEVDARYVIETEEGRAARVFWEKAHAMGRRAERKRVRDERQGKRELKQAQRSDKDEL
ncbi:unnamed protein product [Parascedosporium putredinis]|uniref:Uncharacterized protein n=1 Tax=Parascedosporium putredinis TaxID=1442378 RepID=A0A9P1M808_9PEZI|nr:unnamed protein product [Parascedosporium putredinis]CAI7991649.1 unnamed protein product [Parascedosporium putredinis]